MENQNIEENKQGFTYQDAYEQLKEVVLEGLTGAKLKKVIAMLDKALKDVEQSKPEPKEEKKEPDAVDKYNNSTRKQKAVDEIMAIKDETKRQKAIRDNMELFK